MTPLQKSQSFITIGKGVEKLKQEIQSLRSVNEELVEALRMLFITADSMVESRGIDSFKNSLMSDYVCAHNKGQRVLGKSKLI